MNFLLLYARGKNVGIARILYMVSSTMDFTIQNMNEEENETIFFLPLSFVNSILSSLPRVISFLPSTFSSIRLLTPAPITNVLNVIYPVSTNSQAPFHRVFLLQASLSFLPFFLTHSGPQHSKFLWAIWFRVSPLHLPHAYSTQNLRDAGKQNNNKLLKICGSPVPHKGLGRKFSW